MADEEWCFNEEIFHVKSYDKKSKQTSWRGAGLFASLGKDLSVSIFLSMLDSDGWFFKKNIIYWGSLCLRGYKQPDQAFENWMQRDILFAQMVRGQLRLGYPSLVTGSSQSQSDCGKKLQQISNCPTKNRIKYLKGEKPWLRLLSR